MRIVPQPERRGFRREFVTRQDAELGKTAKRIACRAVIRVPAFLARVDGDAQEPVDQVAGPHGGELALQPLGKLLHRLPQLFDLPRGAIDNMLDPVGQFFQVRQEPGFIHASLGQHVRPPCLAGNRECITALGADGLDQRVDGLLIDRPVRRHVFDHLARQSRRGRSERDRRKVPGQYVPIAQGHRRCGDFARDHFSRLVIEILVVRRAASVPQHQTDTGSTPRTAAALCVVVRPRRNVPHHYGIQPAHVDAHFQGGRTRQQIDRRHGLRRLETLFQRGAVFGRDLGRVLAGDQRNRVRFLNPLDRAIGIDFRIQPSH